jgi:hypothetical protein
VSRYCWEGPYPFPYTIEGISVGRSTVSIVLPVFEDVVACFDRVSSIGSVGPHYLIFQGFLGKGELFDEVTLKGEKYVVNEGSVPRDVWLVKYKLTDKGGTMISLGG